MTTSELHHGVERALIAHFGTRCRIAELEHRLSEYASSYTLEEVDVWLTDGRHLPLVLKDLGEAGLTALARAAKPAFVLEPLREITVYRDILSRMDLGTPVWYGTVLSADAGHHWLLLERIHGFRLWEREGFGIWQDVARWLARAHRRLGELLGKGLKPPSIPRHDEAYFRRWLQRAEAFAGPESLPSIRRIAARYDEVVRCLLALPVTVIHGEFFPANILVDTTAEGDRIAAIDWEMVAVAPGLIDLAALTEGIWTDEQRAAMALSYYDELTPLEKAVLEPEAFLRALDVCRLHLCVQWLGWSDRWDPLPQHRHDWLGKALQILERLAL